MCSKLCLSLIHTHMHLHMCKHMYTQKHTHTRIHAHTICTQMHMQSFCLSILVCSCLLIISFNTIFLPCLALEPPLLSITSGSSSWLYVEWKAQSATFRVLYRESGAPDYQVIMPTTSQLSHNISALQPNTLYKIVVETAHNVIQEKVNSSVNRVYTISQGVLAYQ